MGGQRYSGPELEDLLDRVVSELGPAAEISAVNKIRSGGVAGFFCREEYEIVVGPTQDPAEDFQPVRESEPTQESEPVRESEPIQEFEPIHGSEPTQDFAPTQDLESAPEEVFGGPRPRALDGSDQRFLELLERRLEETSATESHLVGRRVRRPSAERHQPVPVSEPTSGPAEQPPVVAPSRHIPEDATEIKSPDRFWAKVSKARHELASIMPSPSPFLAVIGPLSLTTPIVRRLRADADLGSADVVVLTDRAEIVSEPNWQLVRSGHQLVDIAVERADWPTLLVIDVPVDLPQWVGPLQQRLRLAGVDVFRYAVPADPSDERLGQYRLRSDVPYVLDLVSRVDPARIVQLVEQQHPVGSVGGAPLTAELLVAMRERVGLGR